MINLLAWRCIVKVANVFEAVAIEVTVSEYIPDWRSLLL